MRNPIIARMSFAVADLGISVRAPRLLIAIVWLSITVLSFGALFSAPTHAQQADDSWIPDKWLFDQALKGLGLKRGDENIDYRERSPLVVPPSMDLPVPEQRAAAPRPDWPTDPEIRERRARAANEATASADPDEEAKPLTPTELARGRSSRPNRGPDTDPSGDESAKPMSPSALGSVGNVFETLWSNVGPEREEFGAFRGEPSRKSLTQPPPGYQTPSPSQPYGLSKSRAKREKPKDFVTDHVVAE